MAAERGASKNTVESYRLDLEQFAGHEKKDISAITAEDVTVYIAAISRRFAKSSLSRKISALKQFFSFLKSEKMIAEDPTRLIELPKKDKVLPKFLTEAEVAALKQEALKDGDAQGFRIALFIDILAGSGLRVSEIISLKKNSIQNTIVEGKKHYFLLVKGKGDKERIAPLTAAAIESLEKYLVHWEEFLTESQKARLKAIAGGSWLFPSKGKQGYITRQQLANLLKNYAIRAGIDPEKISPHVLRHSFATNILEKGMDLRVLQEILGHSDISTTQIYTHINISKIKDFVGKNHPLAKTRIS